jgi:hypothetical protein
MKTTAPSLLVAALVAMAGTASAAGPETDDVGALEKQLEEARTVIASLGDAGVGSTASGDCQTACRALGSMRRAAERICMLEPGPRCDAARSKASDATRRVHDACPDCTIAGDTFAPAPAAPPRPAPESESAAEAGPRRGGCASCAAAERDRSLAPWLPLRSAELWLALAASAVLLRRRRR